MFITLLWTKNKRDPTRFGRSISLFTLIALKKKEKKIQSIGVVDTILMHILRQRFNSRYSHNNVNVSNRYRRQNVYV